MAINGRSFLDVARLLYERYKEGNYQEEHIARSCINRAYYAAFLEARDKAGIRNSGGSVHKETHDFYITKKLRIKNKLVNLKGKRQKADYDLSEDVMPRELKDSLNLAKNIIEELDALTF